MEREWIERGHPDEEHRHLRHFISSRPAEEAARLGTVVREHWSVEKRNLPSLIVDYQHSKQLAIKLILKARPFP